MEIWRNQMNPQEKEILKEFRKKVTERFPSSQVILFGSRARGDAGPQSDADVVVILKSTPSDEDQEYISDSAWETGYLYGLVIVPVVFSLEEWESGPERFSLLVQAVQSEGIPL
jgi:predicted nucleotidyltransferase